MYGIDGIDRLAKPGLMRRVIAGSYPSGPSNRESPKIWQMIGANEVSAYNVPSGILFDMIRNAAGKRAGVLTKVGLDTFVDPRRQGCKMNDAAKDDIVPPGRIRRRGMAALPEHSARCGDHPGHHGGRERQRLDGARGRLSGRHGRGPGRAQQRRFRHRAGQTHHGGRLDAAATGMGTVQLGRLRRRRPRPMADHRNAVRPRHLGRGQTCR